MTRKFDKDREFTTERMGRQLLHMGLDDPINRIGSRGRRRKRLRSVLDGGEAMDMDVYRPPSKQLRKPRSRSRSWSQRPSEVVVGLGEGFKNSAQKVKVIKMTRRYIKKRNKYAGCGEADRVIPTLKPKHLFSGKSSIGKSQRR